MKRNEQSLMANAIEAGLPPDTLINEIEDSHHEISEEFDSEMESSLNAGPPDDFLIEGIEGTDNNDSETNEENENAEDAFECLCK
jgi:hypothetical protein